MIDQRQLPKIFPVACHTDNIGLGSTFVAIQGQKQDGYSFIPLALDRGAKIVVVQDSVCLSRDIRNQIDCAGAKLKTVNNTRQALAHLSARAHGYPANKLRIIGVTGTKGKTSTAFMLEHILRNAGHKTALLSTVQNKIYNTVFSASLTTAQPDYLHSFFSLCVEQGVEFVVMEVAAQALSLHRVDGISFDAALFTNFGQEHSEFYEKLDDYFAAKCLLFDQLVQGAPACINGDDLWGKKLLSLYPEFLSFGIAESLLFYSAQPVELVEGLSCRIMNDNFSCLVNCPHLFGRFNVYNLLGAISLANALGVSLEQSTQSIASFSGVPGRLEKVPLANGALAIIDKAHNPSSFHAVLSSLRAMTDNLIVVFGAGGDRDKTKRPQMGRIAAQYVNYVVLTSDNPRSEKASDIIDEIYSGISPEDSTRVVQEVDRELAIKKAYQFSKEGSIIALLGKGPDEYELIGDQKIFFSEKKILRGL